MSDRNNVVISSTIRDLPNHRQEVMDACLRQGMFPTMMEHLPASDADAIKVSMDLVDAADIYVGVFGQRYGYVPSDLEISITEMEYDRAVDRKIPRLIFIMHDDHPITIGDVEINQSEKMRAFKERLLRDNSVNQFISPADLRAHVINSLSLLRRPSLEHAQLIGQQQTLHEALINKDPKLARMYLGSIAVLGQKSNQERLPLAAHGLREMMEKLPKYLEIPVQAKGQSLKQKIQELSSRKDKAARNSSCHFKDGWRGEIDKPLDQLLQDLDEFFLWFIEANPTRKQRIARVIRVLDPSPSFLPKPLEEIQVSVWDRCNSYFQGVSHHTLESSEEEFSSPLSVLERFLLDRLSPRTFEDFAVIDDLIRVVERK